MRKVEVTGKVTLSCQSRIGCRRLAVAVLNQHYQDKNKIIKNIKKLQNKDLLYPSERNRLVRLKNELEFYESFETSKLYSLYYGFVEELIENNQIKYNDPQFMEGRQP